jgi:hypothetical protein
VGLELRNVRIDSEGGVPFLIRDSRQLDLDGVQTRNPKPATPVVRLDRVQGATVRNSIAWPGTAVFLSVAPGQTSTVSLLANNLAAAALAIKEEESDLWKSIGKQPQR